MAVVVCTRDRPEMLALSLAALGRQTDREFETIVVRQGQALVPPAASNGHDRMRRVIEDSGHGLSRARNLGWRSTDADWVVFVDDDCELEPGWIATLKRMIVEHRECSLIAGQVIPTDLPDGPYLPFGVVRFSSERRRTGRWHRPLSVGGGAGVAIRRSTLEALGGWDERLGAGSEWFPAAEDEDFNYRLLRAREATFVTPLLRAHHVQWRRRDELAPLFQGYMIGRGGAAVKHLRSRDVVGGTWLLMLALFDCAVLLASVARFGVRLRLRVGCSSVVGLSIGIGRGLRAAW